MELKKYIFIFIFLILFSQKGFLKSDEIFDIYQIEPDSLKETKEFSIDIEYNTDNSVSIFQILTNHRMSKEFYPDIKGSDTIRPTELFYYGTQEYIEKRRKYWSRFSEYMEQFKNQGIDSYDERTSLFYQTMYNEIGYPSTRYVTIAFSKDDLNNIERNYVNSRYLQNIDNEFFESNILVLILFSHTGHTYPKNYKINNINGKYVFAVEIWDQHWNYVTPLLNFTLFLIKISKTV